MAVFSLSAKRPKQLPDSLRAIAIDVNGVPFTMLRVEGGSFCMGATIEQTDRDIYTDKPAHLVFLSPFYMAATEVTNQLWRAVMGEKHDMAVSGYPQHPVSYVSWADCQQFVRRLDSITGLPFRLPTEAEWEYAARGGASSRHYRFAGGETADSIGWTYPHSGNTTHAVARKHPNELGLYDMTGNVAEWCHDRYGKYRLSTPPDPCGPDTGAYRIVRGGSFAQCVANTHLSVRDWQLPETATDYIGFRLALSLPDDPMKEPVPEEPSLTRNIRIRGQKMHFSLVPAAQPYYISDEVSVSLWKKIMHAAPPDNDKSVAVGMKRAQRTAFAEECSKLSQQPLAVATVAEEDTAVLLKVIQPLQEKRKNRSSVRSVQRKRRVNSKLSPLTELFGVRLSQPDDPVLVFFKGDFDENRPLRLILHL